MLFVHLCLCWWLCACVFSLCVCVTLCASQQLCCVCARQSPCCWHLRLSTCLLSSVGEHLSRVLCVFSTIFSPLSTSIMPHASVLVKGFKEKIFYNFTLDFCASKCCNVSVMRKPLTSHVRGPRKRFRGPRGAKRMGPVRFFLTYQLPCVFFLTWKPGVYFGKTQILKEQNVSLSTSLPLKPPRHGI